MGVEVLPMQEELSAGEVSRRTGEPAERLDYWRSLGLLGAEGSDQFRPEDVERVRLIQLCLRRGITLEVVAQSAKSGLLDRYWRVFFPKGVGPTYSLAEAAQRTGLDLGLLRRFWEASRSRGEDEALDEEDIQAMVSLREALDAGFPQEALLQLVRVYADALERVAEAEHQLGYFYFHEGLKRSGLLGQELAEAEWVARERLTPLTEPTILYFHRKALAKIMREDFIVHLAEEAEVREVSPVPGQISAAVVFADLSHFTPLAEAMGDAAAADVLERFSALVRAAAGRCEGRVVKQIGDAFMLVFSEPGPAVACALEIEQRAASEPRFPAARCGIQWGQVLYREGDYVGSNVNVAARLAAEAKRHQVLVTGEVQSRARALPQVEFVPLGERRLKGRADPLELFEARSSVDQGRDKSIDPVCGMELGPLDEAARLSFEGTDWVFCTEECLRRFMAAPDRYSSRRETPA